MTRAEMRALERQATKLIKAADRKAHIQHEPQPARRCQCAAAPPSKWIKLGDIRKAWRRRQQKGPA